MIEARLRQLAPPAQELVGLAATVGRAFTLNVLRHASGAGCSIARWPRHWQQWIAPICSNTLLHWSDNCLRVNNIRLWPHRSTRLKATF